MQHKILPRNSTWQELEWKEINSNVYQWLKLWLLWNPYWSSSFCLRKCNPNRRCSLCQWTIKTVKMGKQPNNQLSCQIWTTAVNFLFLTTSAFCWAWMNLGSDAKMWKQFRCIGFRTKLWKKLVIESKIWLVKEWPLIFSKRGNIARVDLCQLANSSCWLKVWNGSETGRKGGL